MPLSPRNDGKDYWIVIAPFIGDSPLTISQLAVASSLSRTKVAMALGFARKFDLVRETFYKNKSSQAVSMYSRLGAQ